MQLYMKKKKKKKKKNFLFCSFVSFPVFLPSPNQALVSEIYAKTEYSKAGRYTTHK